MWGTEILFVFLAISIPCLWKIVLSQETLTGFTSSTHPLNLLHSQLCTLGPSVCLGQQLSPRFGCLQHVGFWDGRSDAQQQWPAVCAPLSASKSTESVSLFLTVHQPLGSCSPCVIWLVHIKHSLQLRIGPERRNCCSSSVTFLL